MGERPLTLTRRTPVAVISFLHLSFYTTTSLPLSLSLSLSLSLMLPAYVRAHENVRAFMRLSTDKSTYLLSTFLPMYLSILSPKTCFHATPSLTIWGSRTFRSTSKVWRLDTHYMLLRLMETWPRSNLCLALDQKQRGCDYLQVS